MGTHPIFESDFDCLTDRENGGSQRTPQEVDLGKETEAKPTSAQLDPIPYGQYHQVQCQETALAPHQDRLVNYLAAGLFAPLLDAKYIFGLRLHVPLSISVTSIIRRFMSFCSYCELLCVVYSYEYICTRLR